VVVSKGGNGHNGHKTIPLPYRPLSTAWVVPCDPTIFDIWTAVILSLSLYKTHTYPWYPFSEPQVVRGWWNKWRQYRVLHDNNPALYDNDFLCGLGYQLD